VGWRDVLWLAVGAVIATVIMRRTRTVLPGLVRRWPAWGRLGVSVVAGLLIGIAPQIGRETVAPWIAFVAMGLALGAWTATVLGSSGLVAWVHRIAFLVAVIASGYLGRSLFGS
jgi:hypothetical protein